MKWLTIFKVFNMRLIKMSKGTGILYRILPFFLAVSGIQCEKMSKLDRVCSIPYIEYMVYNINPNTLQVGFSGILVKNGSVKSAVWDFGDGTTFTGLVPSTVKTYPKLTSSSPTVTYNVKFTVENECGKAYWVKSIKVGPCLPTVNFSVTSLNDSTVTITNQSTSPTTANYNWQFGDGTSQLNNATTFTKRYSTSGTYNIILQGTNTCGDNFFSVPVVIRKLPIVETLAPAQFNGSTVLLSGNVLSTGGNTITARGVCWSNTTSSPTIANARYTLSGSTGAYSAYAGSLIPSQLYYARAYATTSAGTAYGPTISFLSQYGLRVQGPSGGLVFHDKGFYSSGWRYLEAMPSDTSALLPFGCSGTSLTTMSYVLGEGLQNTDLIVSRCPTIGIAARYCSNLVYNGFSDWYLPNREEARLLFFNLRTSNVGNLTGQYYQTSNESSATTNQLVFMSNGTFAQTLKTSNFSVRAIRRF
jgi:hypothetical protein